MNTLRLFNPSIIGELYDHDQCDNDLVDKMGYVIRYYREGHAHYIKYVKDLGNEEYLECLGFLDELKRLAEDMTIHDEANLIYRRSDQLELNITPLYKYLEKYDLRKKINQIKVIKGRIHDYMHANNFTSCAGNYEIMDQWEFFFNLILSDHANR